MNALLWFGVGWAAGFLVTWGLKPNWKSAAASWRESSESWKKAYTLSQEALGFARATLEIDRPGGLERCKAMLREEDAKKSQEEARKGLDV